jgi:hypothetical protein
MKETGLPVIRILDAEASNLIFSLHSSPFSTVCILNAFCGYLTAV